MTSWEAAGADVLGDIRRWLESERERPLVHQPTVLPRSLLGYYAEHVILDEAAAMGIDAVIEDPPPVFHEGGPVCGGGPGGLGVNPDSPMINYSALMEKLLFKVCARCGTRYAAGYGEMHVVCSQPRTPTLDMTMINKAQREWEESRG